MTLGRRRLARRLCAPGDGGAERAWKIHERRRSAAQRNGSRSEGGPRRRGTAVAQASGGREAHDKSLGGGPRVRAPGQPKRAWGTSAGSIRGQGDLMATVDTEKVWQAAWLSARIDLESEANAQTEMSEESLSAPCKASLSPSERGGVRGRGSDSFGRAWKRAEAKPTSMGAEGRRRVRARSPASGSPPGEMRCGARRKSGGRSAKVGVRAGAEEPAAEAGDAWHR